MTANQPPENNAPQTPAGPPQTPPPGADPAFAAGRPQAPDVAPPGAYPPAVFAPQQPPAPQKKSVLKRFLVTIVGVIVAIGIGIAVRSGVFDSPSMKAGDCVQQVGEDDVKVVDCGSAEAQYSILGIVEKQSQISARMGACKEFPDTTSVYWEGRNNGNGTVYCMKKL